MKDMQPTRSEEGTNFPSVHFKDAENVEPRKAPIHCGDILPCSCKATVHYVGQVDMLCAPHHEYEAQSPGSARKFSPMSPALLGTSCLAGSPAESVPHAQRGHVFSFADPKGVY